MLMHVCSLFIPQLTHNINYMCIHACMHGSHTLNFIHDYGDELHNYRCVHTGYTSRLLVATLADLL